MKSISFLAVLVLLGLALAAGVLCDGRRSAASRARVSENQALAQALLITDLALWTEARHTRHPSHADRFAPFQNGPGTPDLFPAGTWVRPPRPAQNGPP